MTEPAFFVNWSACGLGDVDRPVLQAVRAPRGSHRGGWHGADAPPGPGSQPLPPPAAAPRQPQRNEGDQPPQRPSCRPALVTAAVGEPGGHESDEQQRHKRDKAPGRAHWPLLKLGPGPGRQVGQQPVKVSGGARAQGAGHPLPELALVEPARRKVLTELGCHGVALGVGRPQTGAATPAGGLSCRVHLDHPSSG
jgi:hypothetical protein